MKKAIFTLTLCSIFGFAVNATVRTVSNDPKAPAQYTGIQAAITASSNGDTIMVYGSATHYGNITLEREIVLIGAGYWNSYGQQSYINQLYLRGAGALSASNSVANDSN